MPWQPAEGPACPPGRPNRADQRSCQRGPHCTFLGSIAALLVVETRRRSPSVGNPLLPARAEGTSLWINPCTFHERRMYLPSSTFHTAHAVEVIMHVTSARVCMTPLACARGEHQYVSDIEVEKEQAASTLHTRIPPNMAWNRLYRPPYAFYAAWASSWLCLLCCEKHHSCSL